MRLALLCEDPAVGDWVEALASDPDHEIVVAATPTPACAGVLRGASGIRLTPHGEDLVGDNSIDAVLVGGSAPVILDAIRQLAAAGQQVIFLPDAAQGSTFLYELSLIRDDNHVPLHPAAWWCFDPAIRQAREQVHSGPSVALLQMQRVLPVAGTPVLPLSDIDRALLMDLLLLRWLGGDYDQVTSLPTGVSESGRLGQSVKLAGRSLPEAVWEIRGGPVAECRLTGHGAAGPWYLEWDTGARQWRFHDASRTVEGDRETALRASLDALNSDQALSWSGLVKGFETLDATHRSVTRRRTIELHFESMSERAIFKTQMTAIGCSVLMATLVLVLVYLAIASTVPLPTAILNLLRGLVFAPLGLFLLLQLLYPLTRPTEAEGRTSRPRDE